MIYISTTPRVDRYIGPKEGTADWTPNMKWHVPVQGDDLAAFMTNVSVGEDSRGQGIGKALLEQSIQKAKSSWGAARIFAFVDSDNEVGPVAGSPAPLRIWTLMLSAAC